MSWLRRYAFALACTVAAVGFAILAHHSTGVEHWIFIFGYQIASVLFGGSVCAELVFGGLKNNLAAMAVLNGLLRQLKAGQPFEWGGRIWAVDAMEQRRRELERLFPREFFPPKSPEERAEGERAAAEALAEMRRSTTPLDCCEALPCGDPGPTEAAQSALDAAAKHDVTAKVMVADNADGDGLQDRLAEDKDSSCGP